jgi:hypothetical protein
LWIGQLIRLTNSRPERNLTGVMGALGVSIREKRELFRTILPIAPFALHVTTF